MFLPLAVLECLPPAVLIF